MLVEDDTNEVVNATKILRGYGFKVMVATNLTDATAYFNMLKDKLSGIVTDLHFPQMDFNHPKDSADKPSGFRGNNPGGSGENPRSCLFQH